MDNTAVENTEFDVVIIGGGPVGSALALLLAQFAPDPRKIALCHNAESTRYGYATPEDPRVIAVNEGSRTLLSSLHAWPASYQPIQMVHVSQRGRLGRTLIDPKDFGVQALGYIVQYAGLQQQLLQAAQKKGITVRQGQQTAHVVQEVQSNALTDSLFPVTVIQDEHRYRCQLAVVADGMPSGHSQPTASYKQVALIGCARAFLPRTGWAYERFTSEGPLAVLPHPAGADVQSVVWCCSPDQAQQILTLPLEQASQALTHAFGDRLGSLTLTAPLNRFNLYTHFEASPVSDRVVALGNAAQTLHPVAGQGLNLGLRDAATLSHCLRDWIARTPRTPAKPLQIYQQLRKTDRQLTRQITSLMSEIFATRLAPVEHVAGLTLLAMDTLPFLRAPLARHLMQGLRQ